MRRDPLRQRRVPRDVEHREARRRRARTAAPADAQRLPGANSTNAGGHGSAQRHRRSGSGGPAASAAPTSEPSTVPRRAPTRQRRRRRRRCRRRPRRSSARAPGTARARSAARATSPRPRPHPRARADLLPADSRSSTSSGLARARSPRARGRTRGEQRGRERRTSARRSRTPSRRRARARARWRSPARRTRPTLLTIGLAPRWPPAARPPARSAASARCRPGRKNASAAPKPASITTIGQIGDRPGEDQHREQRVQRGADQVGRRPSRGGAAAGRPTRRRSARSATSGIACAASTMPTSVGGPDLGDVQRERDEHDPVAERARARRQPQQPELAVTEDGAHRRPSWRPVRSTSSSTRGSARGPGATPRRSSRSAIADVHYEDPLTPEPIEGAAGARRARASGCGPRSPTRACTRTGERATDGHLRRRAGQGARHPRREVGRSPPPTAS